MDMLTEKLSDIRESKPTSSTERLPKEGSKEFRERCDEVLRQVVQKYAWTAQQEGIVLRRNPLKQSPYRDYIFDRIAKVEYGFFYRDRGGKKRLWYPKFEYVLGATLEEEEDFGFIVAERIEFLPGKEEVTHDVDGCRVLNLWRPRFGMLTTMLTSRGC
jgi:hypothetical protein